MTEYEQKVLEKYFDDCLKNGQEPDPNTARFVCCWGCGYLVGFLDAYDDLRYGSYYEKFKAKKS